MKIETVIKATITFARRFPIIGPETHIKVGEPGLLIYTNEPLNIEQISLECYTDGQGDFLLIGYGPETDALVSPKQATRYHLTGCPL